MFQHQQKGAGLGDGAGLGINTRRVFPLDPGLSEIARGLRGQAGVPGHRDIMPDQMPDHIAFRPLQLDAVGPGGQQ